MLHTLLRHVAGHLQTHLLTMVVVYSVRTFFRFACFNSHKQRTDSACYKDFRLLDNFTAVIHAINAKNYSLTIVLTATDHRSHRLNVNVMLINAAVFSININGNRNGTSHRGRLCLCRLAVPHLISNLQGCFLLSQYHYINLIYTGFQVPKETEGMCK